MKQAFTLAEVLITLGIIGVVAALTIPTLIGNYQKKEVATRLQKMYNTIQNAISMAEEENGPSEFWIFEDSNQSIEFYNNNIRSKMNCIKIINRKCYLTDGSVIELSNYTPDGLLEIVFYPFGNQINNKKYTRYRFGYNVWLAPNTKVNWKLTKPKTEVTHMATIANSLTRDQLLNGTNGKGPGNAPNEYCNSPYTGVASCFQLIKRDGWTIAKDYPW